MVTSNKNKINSEIKTDKLQGWTNFFLGARLLDRARKKMGAKNQSAPPIEAQQETLLFVAFYINSSYSFIVNVFPSKVFVMRLL